MNKRKRLFSTGYLIDQIASYSIKHENEPETGCPPVALEMLMMILTCLRIIIFALGVLISILLLR